MLAVLNLVATNPSLFPVAPDSPLNWFSLWSLCLDCKVALSSFICNIHLTLVYTCHFKISWTNAIDDIVVHLLHNPVSRRRKERADSPEEQDWTCVTEEVGALKEVVDTIRDFHVVDGVDQASYRPHVRFRVENTSKRRVNLRKEGAMQTKKTRNAFQFNPKLYQNIPSRVYRSGIFNFLRRTNQ